MRLGPGGASPLVTSRRASGNPGFSLPATSFRAHGTGRVTGVSGASERRKTDQMPSAAAACSYSSGRT